MKHIFTILLLSSSILLADTMSVQVKNTYMRTTPSFLGKKIIQLKYADAVSVNKEQNNWINVFFPDKNKNGWIHSSALSNKRIVLKESTASTNQVASKSEIVMAGKGFSKEVEDEYKQQNKSLNYTLVDKIEKTAVSNTSLLKFAKNGSLHLTN